MYFITFILLFIHIQSIIAQENTIVLNTWHFVNSTLRAWDVLQQGGSALDAVQEGASVCEHEQCDGTVGYGGSPDENGETTLDALIMDGKSMNVGAVGCLRNIKSAIAVARHVLEKTKHSILVGELATQFAKQMGFKEESLATAKSKQQWSNWYNKNKCQPNFWMNVSPDPTKQCGPYNEVKGQNQCKNEPNVFMVDRFNHDTIGILAIDENGDIAAGTSTNGAKYKIPGRVGDSPIPGSGAYADNTVGGAAATGDGDTMLRFLPSFLAVEEMRRGSSPKDAAKIAVQRIAQHYPSFMGAVIAVNIKGIYGAACHGIDKFPFSVKTKDKHKVVIIEC